jgi:hypothetical protein
MEKTCRLSGNTTFSVLVLILLAGCAAGPGKIREGVSPFDGARETALAPACVEAPQSGRPCALRLGLFKRSTMGDDAVILIAVAQAPGTIAEGQSLYFRVQGREIPFASIDRQTRYAIGTGPHTTGAATCSSPGCSVKRYLVSRDFLKSLIDAPSASLRIVLKEGDLECRLSDDDPGLALPSFREFYRRMFGQ